MRLNHKTGVILRLFTYLISMWCWWIADLPDTVFIQCTIVKRAVFEQESQDGKTCFVKLHVPWQTALIYAERMKMKMPLKDDRIRDRVEDDHEFDCSCMTKAFSSCLKPFKLNSADMLEQVW